MHQDEDPADKSDGKPGNARRDGWENKNKSRLKEFEKLRLPLCDVTYSN